MTQVSPDMVERAAKAMESKRAELQHLPLARIYAELFTAGFSALVETRVMVPREPTVEMMVAGATSLIDGQESRHGSSWAEEAELAYHAMIAAAPTPEQQQP